MSQNMGLAHGKLCCPLFSTVRQSDRPPCRISCGSEGQLAGGGAIRAGEGDHDEAAFAGGAVELAGEGAGFGVPLYVAEFTAATLMEACAERPRVRPGLAQDDELHRGAVEAEVEHARARLENRVREITGVAIRTAGPQRARDFAEELAGPEFVSPIPRVARQAEPGELNLEAVGEAHARAFLGRGFVPVEEGDEVPVVPTARHGQ